jgi:hypothetical protein
VRNIDREILGRVQFWRGGVVGTEAAPTSAGHGAAVRLEGSGGSLVKRAKALRQEVLREDVQSLLRGGGAHVTFERAVAHLPEELRGRRPRGAPYTPWQQLEHMRLAQWDILEYIRNPHHVSPDWPQGYWPAAAPPTRDAWDKCVRAFKADRRALLDLAGDPSTDLLARVPHDPEGPTILHELLLVADHNAYHLGQLIVLRRLLGGWPE